ncbi:Unknown protein, partial [Striga hermonthica]
GYAPRADDILLTGSSASLITNFKSYLYEAFTIKDLWLSCFCLGLEILRTPEG